MTSEIGTTSAAGVVCSCLGPGAIACGEAAAGISLEDAAQAAPSRHDAGSSAGTASTSVSFSSARGPSTVSRVTELLVHSRSAKKVDIKTSPATASRIKPPIAVVRVEPTAGPKPGVARPRRVGFAPGSVPVVDAKDTGGVSAKGSLPSRVLLSCILGTPGAPCTVIKRITIVT